jgi:hypothetical protein
MSYKLFLSHSTKDALLADILADSFRRAGIEVFVAEQNLMPGYNIEENIFSSIDKSDCVIVLLTKNGVNSNYVHQEIGFAKKANKLIIPIVEKNIDHNALASLQRIKYIQYDPADPLLAYNELHSYIGQLKKIKEENDKGLGLLFLIGAGILIFASAADEK